MSGVKIASNILVIYLTVLTRSNTEATWSFIAATKPCHSEPQAKNPYPVLLPKALSLGLILGMLRFAQHDILCTSRCSIVEKEFLFLLQNLRDSPASLRVTAQYI